jgi:hypothetical protein
MDENRWRMKAIETREEGRKPQLDLFVTVYCDFDFDCKGV